MTSPPPAPEIPAEIQPEVQRLARETVNSLDSLVGPAAQSPVARTLLLLMFAGHVAALARAHGQQEAREPKDYAGLIQQAKCLHYHCDLYDETITCRYCGLIWDPRNQTSSSRTIALLVEALIAAQGARKA